MQRVKAVTFRAPEHYIYTGKLPYLVAIHQAGDVNEKTGELCEEHEHYLFRVANGIPLTSWSAELGVDINQLEIVRSFEGIYTYLTRHPGKLPPIGVTEFNGFIRPKENKDYALYLTMGGTSRDIVIEMLSEGFGLQECKSVVWLRKVFKEEEREEI